MGAARQGGRRGPVRAARNPPTGQRDPAPVRRLYQGRQKLGRLGLWQSTGEVQLRRRRGLCRRSCSFPGAPSAAVLPNSDGRAAITSGLATGCPEVKRLGQRFESARRLSRTGLNKPNYVLRVLRTVASQSDVG